MLIDPDGGALDPVRALGARFYVSPADDDFAISAQCDRCAPAFQDDLVSTHYPHSLTIDEGIEDSLILRRGLFLRPVSRRRFRDLRLGCAGTKAGNLQGIGAHNTPRYLDNNAIDLGLKRAKSQDFGSTAALLPRAVPEERY